MIRTLRVTVNGHVYDVTVEDRTDTGNRLYPQPGSMTPTASDTMTPSPGLPLPTPAPAAAGVQPTLATGAVLAPMSGVLVELLVTPGQQVSAGETVAIIEAMKMKTPIVVEEGGTIVTVDVTVGDGVQVGQTIVTLT